MARLGKGLAALIPETNENSADKGNSEPIDIIFGESNGRTQTAEKNARKAAASGSKTVRKTERKDHAVPSVKITSKAKDFRINAYYTEIPLTEITENRKQPRTVFDQEALKELADSIKQVGVLEPVIVREIKDAKSGKAGYELIMGERRFRASKLAGNDRIPAIVKQTDDDEMLRTALIENIHRVNLTPLEEAAAYQQLMSDFNFTQQELSRKIGLSRPKIANTLRLLKLPPAVQKGLMNGDITAGHARALLGLGDMKLIENLYKKLLVNNMSVRKTEKLVQSILTAEKSGKTKAVPENSGAEYKEFADELADILMTDVKIDASKSSKKIVINFSDADDLQRIIKIIKRQ